jgi:hypothetical protein
VNGADVYQLLGKPVPEHGTDGQSIAPRRAAATAEEVRHGTQPRAG